MENEELKSFQITLPYIDKIGIEGSKAMTIKLGAPKNTSTKGITTVKTQYTVTFTLVIPDHIHKVILGKSVPMSGISARNELKSFDKYPKSITRETLSAVCDEYWLVLSAYRWLTNIEKAELRKVIFYKLGYDASDFNSSWNGVRFGKESEIKYRYAIGYVSGTGDKAIRYNQEKRAANKSYDSELYHMEYVNWSEEREAFFVGINNSFESIIAKLSEFSESLTEDTINTVISSGMKLLK